MISQFGGQSGWLLWFKGMKYLSAFLVEMLIQNLSTILFKLLKYLILNKFQH